MRVAKKAVRILVKAQKGKQLICSGGFKKILAILYPALRPSSIQLSTRNSQAQAFWRPVQFKVYAWHGRELMRLKSSVCEPCYLILRLAKVLAEGKRLR